MEQLIPQAWFDGQPQWLLLLVAIVAMGTLIKGADWLVDGASGMAYRLGVPKAIVGATIVALGTTSPECAVSVMAAWSGNAGLALGNAVGSVIADTALIFGLGCLLTRMPADRFVLTRQGWVQFGSGVLLAGVCYGLFAWRRDAAALTRPVGLALLALLGLYLAVSVRWSRQHSFSAPFQAPKDTARAAPATPAPTSNQPGPAPWVLALLFVVGLGLVIPGSRALVCSMTTLATRWGVPQVVIAATLVALGTSLPELVVGLTSIAKGHQELLVGNVIGADVLNILFVTGASAVAAPLFVVEGGNRIFLYLHLPTMMLVLVMFRLFIHASVRRGCFSRWYGIPLLAVYVTYTAAQFLVGRG